MKQNRATVMAGNTEAFLLEYSDIGGNPVDPTSIELKLYESRTGEVYFCGDVTNEVEKDAIGKYRYFYQIPESCDNLVVETTAVIREKTFVDRAVAKVINSRNMEHPNYSPK